MTWDITTPLGSDPATQGAANIRQLKADLQTALRGGDVEGVEAKFPGSDTSNPVFRYRGLKGATAARPTPGEYGLFFDSTRNVLQRDNGSSWDDVGTVIPAGSVTVWYQAAAPVGWTKINTQDDKALRVVSGAGGGTGGSKGLSTAFVLAHTHTVAAHHHAIPHKHLLPISDVGGGGYRLATDGSWGQGNASRNETFGGVVAGASSGSSNYMYSETTDTANSSDASPATDSQLADVTLAYIDVILASKD